MFIGVYKVDDATAMLRIMRLLVASHCSHSFRVQSHKFPIDFPTRRCLGSGWFGSVVCV